MHPRIITIVCIFSIWYASGASIAMEESNNEPTNRQWKSCTYGMKNIEGTLLENQPPRNQKNYKSCRRRCIQADGCNYWSFVNKRNTDVALRGKCYLFSALDTSKTVKDTGRISGDLSCTTAQTLKVAIRPLFQKIAALEKTIADLENF